MFRWPPTREDIELAAVRRGAPLPPAPEVTMPPTRIGNIFRKKKKRITPPLPENLLAA